MAMETVETDSTTQPTTKLTPILNQSSSVQQLPITAPAVFVNRKKLTLIPLIFLIYFEVAGGPFGEEPVIKAAGPLLGILGFLIFPFIWSVPEALITAELCTAYPGDGGFVIWVERAFGPFFGSLMGTWKFFSTVINVASFPALGIQYLERLFPIFSVGLPRYLAVCISTAFLSFLNYTGLNIVGWVAVALGFLSLMPFIIMSLVAIPRIHPHRWLSLGQKGTDKDWNLFFNTLFWNLNYWDSVSTLAGEVDRPHKNFPLGLLSAVILTCVAYLFPLIAVSGAISVDQSSWDTGFMANAAAMIVGKWLKIWIEIGAVLSAAGLFEAQLSSCSYMVLGMADIGFLPRFFSVRSKWFNTPWLGILISTVITLGVSFMDFIDLVSSANFIYSLGMLLEFASFLWLRRKKPFLKRPYRVPLDLPGLLIMCLVPSIFLIFLMAIATKTVVLVSCLITAAGVIWFFFIGMCKSRNWCVFSRNFVAEEEVEEHGKEES